MDACADLAQIDASSAFIGAPCATTHGSFGAYAKNGPASLRKAISDLTANINRQKFDLGGPTFPKGTKRAVDCGDLPWSKTDFSENRRTIRDAVSTVVRQGVVPIVIGGDDYVPIPMIEAMGDTGETYTILQIDAHIDWRENHARSSARLCNSAPNPVHLLNLETAGLGGIQYALFGGEAHGLRLEVRT